MKWNGDRCDYVPWLQHQLFPDDFEGQDRVLRVVYDDALPLTFEAEEGMAAIRERLGFMFRVNEARARRQEMWDRARKLGLLTERFKFRGN